MKALAIGGLIGWVVALSGCGGGEQASEPDDNAPCDASLVKGSPFGTRCGELIDEQGRVAFLRGVNARIEGLFDVSFDDGRTALEAIPAFDASDAAAIRGFGFDALRLPVNWSGLEPKQDGGFDEAYLGRIDQVVTDAESAGLVVLIDFHQDAYSKEIGEDGAPLWAIVPPPEQLLEGPLTDLDKRRLSAQVLNAFETFFGETQDGTRLRDRFVAAVRLVMERFADRPSVFGIEIFNEPQATIEGVMRLNQVGHPAMREVAPNKLYVFEPPVIRNLTDTALLPEEPLGPMVGYAPHVYTLAFVGTDAQHQSMTKETLRRSNENARNEADAWQMPLIITEWGYDPDGIKALDYVTWQSELQQEYRASSFFWVWKEESQGFWGCHDFDAATGSFSERTDLKRALARVRASRVAGWPVSESFDRASGDFELHFRGNPRVHADHEIAIAPLLGAPVSVECDGKTAAFEPLDFGTIRVGCGRASSGEHALAVHVAPAP